MTARPAKSVRTTGNLKSLPCDQCNEFAFSDDADFVPFGDQLFSTSVFGAFLMAVQQHQILISDDQQGHFLTYARFYSDPGASGTRGCFSAGHRHLPGKTGNVAIERPALVSFERYAFCVSSFVCCAFRTFGKLFISFTSFLLCKKYNLGRGLCVFGGVVMVKFETKVLFQACQAMTTVAFQFRPGLPRNCHAIMPSTLGFRQAVTLAGALNRSPVKTAVLNQRVAFQKCPQGLDNLAEVRLTADCLRTDAVQVDIVVFKMGLGINQEAKGENTPLIRHHCEAELANRGRVGVGGFDIDCNKAVSLLEQVALRGRKGLLGCLSGLNWRVSASRYPGVGPQPFELLRRVVRFLSGVFLGGLLSRSKSKVQDRANYKCNNQKVQNRIPFGVCLATAKGAGIWGDRQASVVCGNAAGAKVGRPRGHTDLGQVYLQAAPFSLPVGLGRAAVASLCALFLWGSSCVICLRLRWISRISRIGLGWVGSGGLLACFETV